MVPHTLHQSRSEQPRCASVTRARIGEWNIELLPRTPYAVQYVSEHPIIGFSFETQFGKHAFASDRKTTFCAMPNGLACVPAGCDVYSESDTGGEYLRIVCSSHSQHASKLKNQFSGVIHSSAIEAAFVLRRALLKNESQSHLLECEHALLVLEACASQPQHNAFEQSPEKVWMTSARLKRIDDLIDAQLEFSLSVGEIASEFGLSTAYFSRQFKKAIGRAPHQYIVDKRLTRARQLLQQTAQDLTSVAFSCGFASHSHMTEQFRRRLGVTPKQLRGS